jgi:general secretion pathway protein A
VLRRARPTTCIINDGNNYMNPDDVNGSGASSRPVATPIEGTEASAASAFALNHDQKFLWLGAPHRAVFEALYAAVLRGCALAVLTGEVGAGKTMLTDAMAARLAAGGAVVGRLVYPSREPDDLWSAIVDAFGLVTDSGGRDAALACFIDLVQRVAQSSRHVLLVIDEAQVLTSDVLAELGRLCDAVRDAAPNMVTVLLVGEDTLESTLATPALADLTARIGMQRRIAALGELDVASYVTHRLACAEAAPDVFTLDGLKTIAALSRGIPRLINTLCARAVVTGGIVDATMVERCARDVVWHATHGRRHTSRDGTSLRSALSRTRAVGLALVVAALLAGADVVALALTRGGARPVASRRVSTAPVEVTAPVAPVRPASLTTLTAPTTDAGGHPPRGRLAPSRDGAPSSAANPQQRSAVVPRRDIDRAAASTGAAKRSSVPNMSDPSTSSRYSTARPDDTPGEPDASDIIDWLLKERSGATAISR